MGKLILAINPGSTSTKISVYEDTKEVFTKTLRHSNEELAPYKNVIDQQVQKLTGSETLSEEILKQAEKLREEARVAGEKLVAEAEKQGEKLVEEAAKKGTLAKIAAERGETLAQMALAWVLRAPAVTSVLIGASKAAQIRENVKVLESAPFTAEELTKIDAIVNG